jgi:hypothetical protein
VFVIEGGAAKSVSARVLGELGGSVFVAGDLGPGAQVVTQGRSLLANGDKVVVKVDVFEGRKPVAIPDPGPGHTEAASERAAPGSPKPKENRL